MADRTGIAAGSSLQIRSGRDLADLTARLQTWLRRSSATAGLEISALRYITTGGASNETLLVEVGGDVPPALRDGLVVRLSVPDVPVFLDVDLHRQAMVMAWVDEHTDVPVPHVVGVDTSCAMVDVPFMVTARVEGVAVPDFPSYNVAGFLHDLDATSRYVLWCRAVETMGRLHSVDASALVGPMRASGGAVGVAGVTVACRALLDWAAASTDVDDFEPYVDWLERHRPDGAPVGLSWGDARPGNMLFHEGRCTAVLDWEFASLGGSLVDLGWWLLFDAVHTEDMGVARLDGLPGRAETIERWCEASGHRADDLGWHEVLAHVRLGLSRSNGFAARRRRGLPVPSDDEPRSVRRLLDRLATICEGQ
jgi:aminoglycoside phosphotransferase (APT) family kinase protein